MPKSDLVTIQLSTLADGLNRFVTECGKNQCADALDVINDAGEVRRRDAFVPIGSGAPHYMPRGAVALATTTGGTTTATATTSPNLIGVSALYVGCRVYGAAPMGQFDGIEWSVPQITVGTPTASVYVQPQYWNGSAWVTLPAFVDETYGYSPAYGSAGLRIPFLRAGRIYWHSKQFTAAWTVNTVASVNAYYIRFNFVDVAGAAITIPGTTLTASAPAIRCFCQGPMTALWSVNVEGRRALVSATDRNVRLPYGMGVGGTDAGVQSAWASGLERGAQLGSKQQNAEQSIPVLLLEDEGAGTWGQITWPRPTVNGTPYGAAGLTYGTASRLTKLKQSFFDAANQVTVAYNWSPDQWRGGRLGTSGVPSTPYDVGYVNLAKGTYVANKPDGFYCHARIRCVAQGAGGTPLNQEREVYNYVGSLPSVDTFYVYPPWTVAPDANNSFQIFGPHAKVEFDGDYGRTYECQTNDGNTITPTTGDTYEPNPATHLVNSTPQYFRLGRELRWTIDAADRWCGTSDPVTGRFLLTNGNSGLLEFDGRYLRKLRADYTTAAANALIGVLPDQVIKKIGISDPKQFALSQLRRAPPNGSFVAVHQGAIFVAGLKDEPFRIQWSAFGGMNNVWPFINDTMVRDAEQDPITGLHTLDNRLVISTATALHELQGPTEDGYYEPVPLSRGIGFVAQTGVCVVAGGVVPTSRLVGIGAGGIYGYSQGEPQIVLDNWRRMLPEGVNQENLHLAVAVAAPQRNLALFAVPARGSAANNFVLVWDYFRNVWWLWSAPFGVSSMAVDYHESGKERILFGTDDGYIMTVGDGPTDDGTAINAYALSPPVQPGGGAEVALQGLLLTAQTLGASAAQQMSCDLYLGDDTETPYQQGALSIDKGDPVYGDAAAVYGTSRAQKHGWKTVRLNVDGAARAHRFSYRVGGAVKWAVRRAEALVRPHSKAGR